MGIRPKTFKKFLKRINGGYKLYILYYNEDILQEEHMPLEFDCMTYENNGGISLWFDVDYVVSEDNFKHAWKNEPDWYLIKG